jgi:tetraacyldisaccharide-1-P 4'-kinase
MGRKEQKEIHLPVVIICVWEGNVVVGGAAD